MHGQAIPLALGSWFFALNPDVPTKVRPSEFFGRVQRCLEAVDGVEDIEIDLASFSGEDEPVEMPPVAEQPRYGEYTGPHWDFESFSFSLRLPLETQSQLLQPGGFISGREAVNFRVLMRYGWAMPLSCVALLDSPADDDTSQGAIAVYRYMARATERSTEGVHLSCVPPIFAHADVFLHPRATDAAHNRPLWRTEHTVPVQRRYDISFDRSKSADPVSDFLYEVGSELDLYYQIIHSEGDRRHQWQAIDQIVTELTALRRNHGLRGSLKRMLGADRLANEAIIRLTEFAARDQTVGVDLRRQFRNVYTAGATTFVQELADSELADREEYPVEQFSRLVQLFEARRLTDREMIVVLTTSLLGGAVGAAVALLAGS